MKIIAVGMNFEKHNIEMHNKELHHTLLSKEPVIFMKPDSALLNNGKPFFLPEFSDDIHYETEIVVKINRLGKYIDERFAKRYYNELTVGIDFTARDLQTGFRTDGLPWELSKGFDGAAVTGAFIPLGEAGGNIQNIEFHLDIDNVTVQRGNTADMLHSVDAIIAYVSRFCTLKTGDLLFTGTPAGVGKVAIGNHLQGFIGERKLLDFFVR